MQYSGYGLGYVLFPEEVENFAPSTCWYLSCLFVGWRLLPLFVLCGASRNQLYVCGEKGLKDFENWKWVIEKVTEDVY